jgi:hypothetical protein
MIRRWRNPPYHFDNIGVSILTMFQVATVEQWPTIMYHGKRENHHRIMSPHVGAHL